MCLHGVARRTRPHAVGSTTMRLSVSGIADGSRRPEVQQLPWGHQGGGFALSRQARKSHKVPHAADRSTQGEFQLATSIRAWTDEAPLQENRAGNPHEAATGWSNGGKGRVRGHRRTRLSAHREAPSAVGGIREAPIIPECRKRSQGTSHVDGKIQDSRYPSDPVDSQADGELRGSRIAVRDLGTACAGAIPKIPVIAHSRHTRGFCLCHDVDCLARVGG
jgi:hypothetical protein